MRCSSSDLAIGSQWRDPFLAPTVRIPVDDTIGCRLHFYDVPGSVVHAAQRALELELNCSWSKNFRPSLLLSQNPILGSFLAVCTGANLRNRR
jgi:hypothetical protein